MRKKWPVPAYVRAWIPPRETVAPYAAIYWREIQTCAAISRPRGYAAWARLGDICNDYVEGRLILAAWAAEQKAMQAKFDELFAGDFFARKAPAQ